MTIKDEEKTKTTGWGDERISGILQYEPILACHPGLPKIEDVVKITNKKGR